VHTSTVAVESRSVGVRARVLHSTSRISVHIGVAIGGLLRAGLEGVGGHGASGLRVQCHTVVVRVVDTLNDIDLTAVGPVGSDGPNSGPISTPSWHVNYIKQKEASVVGFVACYSHRPPSRTRGDSSVVRADVHHIATHRCISPVSCIAGTSIGHIPMSGISSCKELEVVEETASREVVHQSVGARNTRDTEGKNKEDIHD